MLSSAKSWKLRRLVITALVVMVTIGLFPALGLSTTYTIYPTADATVYVGVDVNWGTDPNLITQPGAISFLKFNLGIIPSTEEITGATFNAYCNGGYPGYGFAVELRAVSDTSWGETTITGKTGNYPAYGSVISTYTTGWQNVYNQWAVGAAYLPRGLVSYALTLSAGSYAFYNSRQNPSNKPYLVVTTKKKPQSPAAAFLLLLD